MPDPTPDQTQAQILAALAQHTQTIGELADTLFPYIDPLDARRQICLAMTPLMDAKQITTHQGRYALSTITDQEKAADQPRNLTDILPIAEQLRTSLLPLTKRLEIAGSIRRRAPEVGDIELCALVDHQPHLGIDPDNSPDPRLTQALCARAIAVIKSGPFYTQAILDTTIGPIKIDLFQCCNPQQWGLLYFYRTGSADFVHRALSHFKKRTAGGYSDANRWYLPSGIQVDTSTEEMVFHQLNCKFVPPEKRVPR